MLRYASLSDDELSEILNQLVSQMSSGIASISYNGQSISYSSITNINSAIEGIEKELLRRHAKAAGYTVKKGARYPRMPGKGFY